MGLAQHSGHFSSLFKLQRPMLTINRGRESTLTSFLALPKVLLAIGTAGAPIGFDGVRPLPAEVEDALEFALSHLDDSLNLVCEAELVDLWCNSDRAHPLGEVSNVLRDFGEKLAGYSPRLWLSEKAKFNDDIEFFLRRCRKESGPRLGALGGILFKPDPLDLKVPYKVFIRSLESYMLYKWMAINNIGRRNRRSTVTKISLAFDAWSRDLWSLMGDSPKRRMQWLENSLKYFSLTPVDREKLTEKINIVLTAQTPDYAEGIKKVFEGMSKRFEIAKRNNFVRSRNGNLGSGDSTYHAASQVAVSPSTSTALPMTSCFTEIPMSLLHAKGALSQAQLAASNSTAMPMTSSTVEYLRYLPYVENAFGQVEDGASTSTVLPMTSSDTDFSMTLPYADGAFGQTQPAANACAPLPDISTIYAVTQSKQTLRSYWSSVALSVGDLEASSRPRCAQTSPEQVARSGHYHPYTRTPKP